MGESNIKHSKPTTKDISDIYQEYNNLNLEMNDVLSKTSFDVDKNALKKELQNQPRLFQLKDIDCVISLCYDEEYFYLNNYLLEVSVLDECFASFNKVLSENLVHLLKSNNSFEMNDSFLVYDWRELINKNQLLLFLSIFNFYVDNPLTFIIDKIFKDFVFAVNNVFTIKNYNVCCFLQYVLPCDIYDISKKPEIITNSEHFMDRVSEILIINHLLSGCVYFFDDSINILVLLHSFFYNNKKMDYTRHSNMKVFKKLLEKIYIHFDMVNHFTSDKSNYFLLSPSDISSVQRKLKNFPLSSLLFKMKQKKMKIDNETKIIFNKWMSQFSMQWDFETESSRIPYCQIAIEQVISLFQLNDLSSDNEFLQKNFIGFNFDLSKNKKYETFYKIMKCPPTEETAMISLKILKKNVSNLVSFQTLEKQLIWSIDQELQNPLSSIKQAANKFIFKAAYYTIHGSYLKFVAGKCLKEEKFKEIYEFVDISRFNDLNTIFYKDIDILSNFKITSDDFIKDPLKVFKETETVTKENKIKKATKNSVSLEDITETERNLNSQSTQTQKPESSIGRIKKSKTKTRPSVEECDNSSDSVSLLSLQNLNTNKVFKTRSFSKPSNFLNLQLSAPLEFDNSQFQLKKEPFDLDLNQYLQTMGLELA